MSKNDITGDPIRTKLNGSDLYRSNFDGIFSKKKPEPNPPKGDIMVISEEKVNENSINERRLRRPHGL